MKNPYPTLAALTFLVSWSPGSEASGVSPYLPLHASPEIERDIERVLILAGKTVLRRPIAAATVVDALPAACELDDALCRRVRRYLDRYTDGAGIADASATVAASSGSEITLPNAYGMTSDSAWRVSAHAYWQPNAYALVNLGGVAYDQDAVPAGSVLSLGFEYAQIDVGFRDHWLSPFPHHAMLLSTQAKTLPSVTLSNYSPISPLGITYELFVAEMEHTNRIVVSDGLTSGEPRLGGVHIAVEPVPGWSVGANRLVQFGGGERGGRSLRDFINALVDPEEFDERGKTSLDEEFGNQLAAWTSEFVFPGSTPFAVYLEYASEDRSYEGNWRFGNAALSFGVTIPRLMNRFDLTYEATEWQNSWYVHTIYLDGLINDGHVLGHWGADARQPGHGIGAHSHLLQVGWEPDFGGLIRLRARTIDNASYSSVPYNRGYDLLVSYSRAFAGYTLSTELLAGKDVFGESFGRLAATMRIGDEWAQGSGTSLASTADVAGAELFLDYGINANEVRVTVDEARASAGIKTDRKIAPHLAIGARRPASKRGDLGVRVELDDINGDTLIALRALDYRYRIGRNFAASLFVGAARYDAPTPAMGFYGGVGIQWRGLTRHMDLNLDARYADKVSRDKVLPNEPREIRPDSFYDISSVSLYLTYRL